LPDSIINYILLLVSKTPKSEYCYLRDAIEWFDIDVLYNSSLDFDIDRLIDINKEHLKLMSSKAIIFYFWVFMGLLDIGRRLFERLFNYRIRLTP